MDRIAPKSYAAEGVAISTPTVAIWTVRHRAPVARRGPISFVGRVVMKVISLDCRHLPLVVQTPTAPGTPPQSTLAAKLTVKAARTLVSADDHILRVDDE
jgi:hypothetical protein